MKHLQEPWEKGLDGRIIYSRFGNFIAELQGAYANINSARIVDCVNACEGINSPKEYIEYLKRKTDRLEKEKQKLIDVLEGIKDTFYNKISHSNSTNREIDALNDANEILTELKEKS